MRSYNETAKIWQHASVGGWHFVAISEAHSHELRETYRKHLRGFRQIPVEVTLGNTTWHTSLFPDKRGPYVLALKARVREKEGVRAGDTVTFSFTVR